MRPWTLQIRSILTSRTNDYTLPTDQVNPQVQGISMSVQKFVINKTKSNFTVFSNTVLQNIRDAATLGVYCYLLSLPEGWVVHKNQLREHFKIGINRMDKIFASLSRFNLIKIESCRNDKGQFIYFDMHVLDGSDFNINQKDIELSTDIQSSTMKTMPMETMPMENRSYKRNNIQNKQDKKASTKKPERQYIDRDTMSDEAKNAKRGNTDSEEYKQFQKTLNDLRNVKDDQKQSARNKTVPTPTNRKADHAGNNDRRGDMRPATAYLPSIGGSDSKLQGGGKALHRGSEGGENILSRENGS